MSDGTSELDERLIRHRTLQNGMTLILGRLRHAAKSITAEDAQSLADNAEAGDEWTASVIAAVADIAIRNKEGRATSNDLHSQSTGRYLQPALHVSQNVRGRFRKDPGSITIEDARRFSENVDARDAHSARLASAIEFLDAVQDDIIGQDMTLEHSPCRSLLEVVEDLYAAVKNNPKGINMELLSRTQSVISIMDKAISHTNVPNPELEAELQQEYAKIVPKVEGGNVNKVEGDYLHSLEARAHEDIERRGLMAIAQSVAARCDRQASIGSILGNIKSHSKGRTLMLHKHPWHETATDHHKAEVETDIIHNGATTAGGAHSREQCAPEDNEGLSLKPFMKHCHPLNESTNTPFGDSCYDAVCTSLETCNCRNTSSSHVGRIAHTHMCENGLPSV